MSGKKFDAIVILNFGSQTTQLIARKRREKKIYAEILPQDTPAEEIKNLNPKGIIFSGGPASLYEEGSPRPDPKVYELGLPILGICYGLQLVTDRFGGEVVKGHKNKEYGEAQVTFLKKIRPRLLEGIKRDAFTVWMSHGDEVKKMPEGFAILGATKDSPFAIIGNEKQRIFGVQFHPEVTHTSYGAKILENFATLICNAERDWQSEDIIESMVRDVRRQVGSRKILHAISGGVDSTVMAAILHKAIGDKLRCVMVDTGLLRKGEVESVRKRFKKYLKAKVEIVDAQERFLNVLRGVCDGSERRRIIGREYIQIFNGLLGKDDLLSQGTLYPDVIESAVDINAPAHTIKTHHNRAPEVIELMKEGRVIEIFKDLFKDEVRSIGEELGLPKEIVWRQPFPGPGLAIRILGEITTERLDILREADQIVIEELKKADLYYKKISQSVVALDDHQVTCVKGDARASGYLIFIRNVVTDDFMTASVFNLSSHLRKKIATRILNEVKGVGRVLFDESTKPPATICYL